MQEEVTNVHKGFEAVTSSLLEMGAGQEERVLLKPEIMNVVRQRQESK